MKILQCIVRDRQRLTKHSKTREHNRNAKQEMISPIFEEYVLFTQRRNSNKKYYKSETEYLSSDENHLHFDPYVIFGILKW